MSDETPVPKRRRARSLNDEINRRASNEVKRAELEARKVAIGELVFEKMDEIAALMRGAGFKVDRAPFVAQTAAKASYPEPPKKLPSLAPVASLPATNPCVFCGKESTVNQPLPGGKKQALCPIHARAEGIEMGADALTASLIGPTAPMVARPITRPPKPVTVIHADSPMDLLKAHGVHNGSAGIIEDPER